MRCRPLRWLWGLFPLAVIAFLAIFGERPFIEQELADRSSRALAEKGLAWAGSEFVGRDATVTGTAGDDDERRGAFEIVQGTWGVRVVDDQAGIVEAISPYPWIASYDGTRLTLRGNIPSAAERKSVNDLVRRSFTEIEITDQMSLGRGSPPRAAWLGGIGFALQQLRRLKEGQVRLEDLQLSIAGTARDIASYRELADAVANRLPRGVTLKSNEVTAPAVSPYEMSVQFDGKRIVLAGYVPGEEQRSAFLERLKSGLASAEIEDRMIVADGQPGNWRVACERSIDHLLQLERGALAFRDTQIDFSGVAIDRDTADTLVKGLKRALPKGFTLVDTITVKDAEQATISPYIWTADFDGRTVIFGGHVPDEEVRRISAEMAGQRFTRAIIKDRTQIGLGSPSADIMRSGMDFGLAQLSKLKSGRLELEDTRLSISGVAADQAMLADIIAALRRLPASWRLGANTVTVPQGEALVWTLQASDEAVELGGTVPSDSARTEMLRYVDQRFAGRQVRDRTEVVASTTEAERDWLRVVQTGVRATALVGDGRARLENRVLEVSGTTRIKDLPDRITSIITAGMPGGYNGRASITYLGPSDSDLSQIEAEAEAQRKADEEAQRLAAETQSRKGYPFAVSYDGLAIELSGSVPSSDVRRRVVALLKQRLPGRTLSDRTRIASGEPNGFSDAAVAVVTELVQLDKGELKMKGFDVALSGETDSESVQRSAERLIERGLPQGFTGEGRIAFVPPPEPDPLEAAKADAQEKLEETVNVDEIIASPDPVDAKDCQAALNKVARRGLAFFRRSSADLDQGATRSLGKLADVAARCPEARISIAGHTDSDGSSAFNQRLSENRAEAVVEYLASNGVDRTRLSSEGFGELKPIRRNNGSRNKARNRRIEFVVKVE